MLKELQKALGLKPADKQAEVEDQAKLAAQAAIDEAVNAAVAGVQAEFAQFKTATETVMAEAAEKINTLTANLAEAQAALEAATNEKAAAEAAALAAKLTARKEKLVAAVGTERADALLLVAEGMDDAAFEAVVSALGVSAAVEATSPMFTEAGVEAEADVAQVVESAEMRILRAKFPKQ